jgi:mannose-1-phosphate guanylyltransferase
MKALVLCAGFGTRLGPLTADIPKPLLSIDGKPLIGYTLSLLQRSGVSEAAINLHYFGPLIEAYVRTGARFGVRVTFSREDALLGTAGSVRSLASFFGDDDALVIYGDLLLDVDLTAMIAQHRARAASATLMLHRRVRSNSVVTMDRKNRITLFRERPDPSEATTGVDAWVNSGVAILSRRLRDRIPEATPCDLPLHVYASLVNRERLFGFPLNGYRCAIDSFDRYEEACRAAREGRVRRPSDRAAET